MSCTHPPVSGAWTRSTDERPGHPPFTEDEEASWGRCRERDPRSALPLFLPRGGILSHSLLFHRCPAAAAVPYRSATADASRLNPAPPPPLSASPPSPLPSFLAACSLHPVPVPGHWTFELRILSLGSSLKLMKLSELANGCSH
ncbi:hypothetical protein QYE76_004522 [Lolium multiflorum]|uniref:Uncharacterized protein n=1 Tax=Lolium multiflorum TaxID=4521 RepID=A0AAD8RTD8_LOLMU|nr:hypothetical protein QYE76_004522 [Lolium multiflorum]